jgi:hypothetical protein
MVSVERQKTKEKFGSREKIRKWKTGIANFFARSEFFICLWSLNWNHVEQIE